MEWAWCFVPAHPRVIARYVLDFDFDLDLIYKRLPDERDNRALMEGEYTKLTFFNDIATLSKPFKCLLAYGLTTYSNGNPNCVRNVVLSCPTGTTLVPLIPHVTSKSPAAALFFATSAWY